jgi:hypothetical protein
MLSINRFMIAFASFLCVTISGGASGSEDPVFVDYRQVDPSGSYYVVVRRLGGPVHNMTSGPVEILIAERRVGSPQIEAAPRGLTPPRGTFPAG